MADFLPAYERMMLNEGGYVLSNTPGDRGGQTYAGIARKVWPQWHGWPFVDRGEVPPTPLVREFYRENFWAAIRGDDLVDQHVAQSIFDFAVNAGSRTSAKLAQIVVGATPDGAVGPVTLNAINAFDPALFCARFTLAKIARYAEIARRDASQRKFLLGWISRALREAA